MLELKSKRIHDLIIDKDALVSAGRQISRDIEDLEKKIKVFEEKEKAITAKIIPPKELTDKGDELVKQITSLHTELTKIADSINQSKLEAIPKEMVEAHKALLKEKEKLERERNKIALKVQKVKDKVVPIIQREVKPLLAEYDDIETAKTKDGKVVIATFNHLDEFKKRFASNQK
jgi:predicted  nucleic acid-binding Zn-ribbon protein